MRLFLLLLAFVLTAPAAFAQSVGLKAGLNTATVHFDDDGFFDGDDPDKQPRLGFVGGVTADVPFSPMLGLRLEALYAQKGFAYTLDALESDSLSFESGTVTYRLDYLELPILLNLTVPMDSGLEVGLLGGIVPAFLVNGGIGCSGLEGSLGGQPLNGCDSAGPDDDLGVESFDLGGALGATVGAGPFAVDLRYTQGLLGVNEDEPVRLNILNRNTATNGAFSITAAYRFGR